MRALDRLGIFGGTFDPPHLGHLILAECAVNGLNLSRVLFVLAADPPHKQGQLVTPVAHRLAMLEHAIADNPCFALSRIDIDRPGPHYSVDMLRLLCAEYAESPLFFLMGGDSLDHFLTWRDPAGILDSAQLAVIRRPGAPFDLRELTAQLPSLPDRLQFVDAPPIGVAASDLRDRIHAGQSIRYQVPDAVAAYIHENHLYED